MERLLVEPSTQRHRGVRIATAIKDDAANAEALTKLRTGLDVLADVWPRHVERLPKLAVAIGVIRLPGMLGFWDRKRRVILLDRDFMLSTATTPEYIASIIVHELTHARLQRAGFQQNADNRLRCERICLLAQRNFHERLPDEAERTRLTAITQPYLDDPAKFWSKEATAARVKAWRMRQPPLELALFDVRRFLRRARRFVFGQKSPSD